MGGLELAPAFKAISTTPSTYIWSIAADQSGNLYAATGAPARVYRITPQGQSTTIFEPQELQVQALVVDKNGILYAATNPDGKVYRIEHAPSLRSERGKLRRRRPNRPSEFSSSVFFDPGTKYIWDLVFDNSGNLYVATGDHGEIFRVTPKGEHSVFFKSDEAHIRVLAVDAKGNLIAGSDGSGLVYQIKPERRGLRALQRAQKRNHRAGHRQGGKYLCRRRAEKSVPGALPRSSRPPMIYSGTPHPRPDRRQPGMVVLNVDSRRLRRW